MLEYLLLLVGLIGAAFHSWSDLVAENLILRQQLAVLTRPTRKRPRLRFRDRFFWVVVRAVRRDWQQQLGSPSDRRPSSGDIAMAGGCSGGGSRALAAADLGSTPRFGTRPGAASGSAASCSFSGSRSASARSSGTDAGDGPTHPARPGGHF
jgi:hypothetical protein